MKFKLSKTELLKLDDYWEFIDLFNDISTSVYDYRRSLIKRVGKKYTIEEFFSFETILNKLLWNLMEFFGVSLSHKDVKPVFKIKSGSSYINKQIMVFGDRVLLFPQYSTLHTDRSVPETLFKILHVLMKRELYENVLEDEEYIHKIKIKKTDKFYYPHDYPFPNVNLIEYNTQKKEIWLRRIKAYYYSGDDSQWYNLITGP